jgi:arylformamidase
MKPISFLAKFILFQTLMFLISSVSAQTLKIMPMGDSNTEGAGQFPGAKGGWRAPLYTFLKEGGYHFDFVGGKTTKGDICPDPNHWGKSGWQISDVPATIDGRTYVSIQGENRSGLYDEMSDAISTEYFSTDTTNTRNIILLQIGVNDILHQVADSEHGKFNSDKGNDGQGEGQEWVAEGMIARLNALLQRIDSLATARNLMIEVMLGTLCRPTKQWTGDAISDVLIGEVKQYDAHISKVVPALKFSNIRVKPVDQYSASNGKLADGVHPNIEGYERMARAWYNAITITHGDVRYGPDKIRNSLDFWQAPGNGPRPLLVNIHGGGWLESDKSIYFDYKPFLDKGISCASINYRFTPDNPLPVPVHDAARAIQFLRSKAAEWSIDPDRIALTGSSAGACTSMWLLLHDDLAEPNAKDPVSRQSTRVCAAAAYVGQTSIDPSVICEWIPSTVPMHKMIPFAVGQQSMEKVWTDNRYKSKSYAKLYQEFSPINHLDANDPPLYMLYNRGMKLPARSDGDFIHHPMFGIKMWEKSNTTAKGHECHLRITSTNEYKTTTSDSYASGVDFLIDKLLAPSFSGQKDVYNQAQPSPNLSADKPGTLRFWGSDVADLYTRQIAESYAGVLRKNFVSEPDGEFPPGFVHASPIPQGWSGTFWSRDGGTFLRELVAWGNFEHAWLSADCFIKLVAKNEEGYFAFPEYFTGYEQRAGHELDGTSSIIIGMVMLWQRLPENHTAKARIYEFLHQEGSPVRYILHALSKNPLLAGSGEFGPGCFIPGMYYNVVQNYLTMLALTAAADMEDQTGNRKDAGNYRKAAQNLRSNILKYLVGNDEAWIWCIDPKTLAPDSAILNHEINLGFGGINGPACMFSDVLGFDPMTSGLPEVKYNLKTFEKLYLTPGRKEQFDKYGIWVQFDVFRGGLSSGPSYGDGYALQTMLLYDKMEMAEKSLKWLATSTYDPVAGYKIDRESPYYFYERSYSPEAVGKVPLEQGCGALNLVNVTEQLKAARLILGVDDTSPDEVKIIPRLPPSWQGMEARNWPIRTNSGLVRANIRIEKHDGVTQFSLTAISGPAIKKLAVRLPDAQGGTHSWYRYTNATKVDEPAGRNR